MNFQLFHMLPSITLPHSGVRHNNGTHTTSQTIHAFPFMYWPSGKPCEPINMYFLDIAHETTGDSLKTYASQLSHLVRYCGENKLTIEKLTNRHIHEFSAHLQDEKSRLNAQTRARNDNTVRDILSRTILFLLWYQETFMLILRTPLIGEERVSPQITIKKIKNSRYRAKDKRTACCYTHSAMPTDESREPKRPIALSIIEDVQRCIDRQSMPEERSPRFLQRYRNAPPLFLAAELEYMRARRHFMLWMMMHTGLRPSELVEMSIQEHKEVLAKRTLEIPTKKRRKNKAPKRSFPISLNEAAVVRRYLISRAEYCEMLDQKGVKCNSGDAFFLTVDGEPLKKSSLEKDFERLVNAAGYRDVQACLSMFRHRFITYEVIAHLKEFINKSGKSRQMMTDIDYESILKRVATKTGHGSAQSLWHYIDLAWEELDVWGSIDKALVRLHAADELFADLLALQHETATLNNRQANRKIDLRQITERLGDILSRAKQDIGSHELHGKHEAS